MNALERLVNKLHQAPPGSEEIVAAANRAAAATNVRLAQQRVPLVAKVRVRGTGARVELIQVAPLRKRFAGLTPVALLHQNVVKEMAVAKRNIAAAARKELRP